MCVIEAELWAVGAAEQCTAYKLKADSGVSLKLLATGLAQQRESVWMPTD